MSTLDAKVDEAFLLCSSLDTPGTFIPCHISMFINRIEKIALWDSVYIHECVHSLLTDTLNGWWIQLLEDIGNNMFVVFRRGDILSDALISWILNLEFKRRKLMESWMQTQEGFATYFQLDVIDMEKGAVGVAAELSKLRHEDFTNEREAQIRRDVEEIRRKWIEKINSRNCPEHYWKGYELVKRIALKFGKENLAPVSMAACAINFPKSMMAQGIDEFQEMILQEKYNVDKRLELISNIPEDAVNNFPLNNDWLGLTERILEYLGETELTDEFDFELLLQENYTNPAFPKDFVEIAKAEFRSQSEKAKKRWENLKNKGIDSSQLVAVFNVEGEAAIMSNFDLVDNLETDEILSLTYRVILTGIDKLRFINDLLNNLKRKNEMKQWMESLLGFGDLERFKDMFPFQKLVSMGEVCLICHNSSKYTNPVFSCPYSGLSVCFACCVKMECLNCEKSQMKQKTLPEITQLLSTFKYAL